MSYVEHTNGYGRTVIMRAREPVECKRSDLAAPRVVRDTIPPTKSVADGREYTSLSEYERSLKAGGYVIADGPLKEWTPPARDRKADRDAIERAIADVDAGRAPPVLTEAPKF